MSASREKRERRSQDAAGREKKDRKSVKPGKPSDRFYNIIAILIAAILVISVGIAVFQNIIASGKFFAAVDIGDEKIYPHEVNYYYINSYLNYVNTYGSYLEYLGLDTSKSLKAQTYSEGNTWHDYFLESALNSVQEIKMLYKEATAAGVTLSEESKAQLESDFESLAASVENQNMDFATYLSSNYGSRMTADEFKRIMGEVYLAQEYSKQVYDSYTYSDEQIRNYYAENKKNFDLVDYRLFYFSARPENDNPTEEETATAKTAAKSLAEIMQAAVTDEQSFINLARENAPEDQLEDYEDPDYTLHEGETYSGIKAFNESMADWLFSDERVAGDTTVVESTGGYYVVFMKMRYRNDYNTQHVRHILVEFETDDNSSEPTEKQIEVAKNAAQALYDEWKAGEATEESFAELAKQHSADGGSKENGGLYESIYKGQMVEEFENWVFDPARKPGDTGLVRTDYGYHIMYYVGSGSPYWTIQVENAIRNNDYSDFEESLKEKNPLSSHYLGLIAVGLPNR